MSAILGARDLVRPPCLGTLGTGMSPLFWSGVTTFWGSLRLGTPGPHRHGRMGFPGPRSTVRMGTLTPPCEDGVPLLHGAWHTVRVGGNKAALLKSSWIDSGSSEPARLVERQSGPRVRQRLHG